MATAVGQINQEYHSPLSAGQRLRLPPWLGKHPLLIPVFPLSQHFPNDFLSWPQVFQQSNLKSSSRAEDLVRTAMVRELEFKEVSVCLRSPAD